MRLDGPTLAALTVTLEAYADGRGAEIPFWRMAALPAETLAARARRVIADAGIDAAVVDGASTIGAGSVPGSEIAGPVIRWDGDADAATVRLLEGPLPVVARRDRGSLVVDLRTVDPGRDPDVATALARACRS
jgi:seryl-tRNA(Sec) selenium transferase